MAAGGVGLPRASPILIPLAVTMAVYGYFTTCEMAHPGMARGRPRGGGRGTHPAGQHFEHTFDFYDALYSLLRRFIKSAERTNLAG